MKTFKQFISEARKIGKVIGGEHYVHKDYENEISDQEGLERAKSSLSPEHREKYNIVKHNKKNGTFSFIHSPDFDESDEPISGDAHKVSPDGKVTITKQKKDPQIYHHKWQWVGDDYKGFDVEKSKQRSKDWGKVTDRIKQEKPEEKVMSKIGTKSYWERMVVPHINEDVLSEKSYEGQEEAGLRTKAKRKITRTAEYASRNLKSLKKQGKLNPNIKADRNWDEVRKSRDASLKDKMKLPDRKLSAQIQGSVAGLKMFKRMAKKSRGQ